MLNKLTNQYIYLGLFLLVCIIHVAIWGYYYTDNLKGDAKQYWDQAYLLYESISNISNPSFAITEPVYLFLIWLSMELFGSTVGPLYLLNILLYLILLLVLYILSSETVKGRFLPLAVIMLVITNYQYIKFNFWVMRETLIITLFSSLITVFYFSINREKLVWFILFGLIYVVLILTDNRYIPYLALFLIYWVFWKPSGRSKYRMIVASVVIIILSLVPWTIRQYIVEGIPSPTSIYRNASIIKHFFPEKYERELKWKCLFEEDKGPLKNDYREFNLTEEDYRKLKEAKINGFWETTWFNMKELWRFYNKRYYLRAGKWDDRIETPWSIQRNLNEVFHTGLLIPFFIIGVIYGLKRRHTFVLLLVAIIGLHTLVHGLTIGQLRYRYVVMPIYTILTVYGFGEILRKCIKIPLEEHYKI